MQDKKILPIIISVLLFSIAIIVLRGTLFPSPEEFIESIKHLYQTHGYTLIFLGAFFEANFLVGFYIPGSTVVLLGAALSKSGVVSFPVVWLLGTLGLVLGYTVNYILGRYGWYRLLARFGFEDGIRMAKDKVEKHGKKAILLGCIHPGSASLISTAAGIVKMPFLKFLLLSLASQLWWSLFWGSIVYMFGLPLVEFTMTYFVYVVLGVGIWLLVKYLKKKGLP